MSSKSDKSLKVKVVNQTLPSLLGGSLASTLTVTFKSIIISFKYDPRLKIKGADIKDLFL